MKVKNYHDCVLDEPNTETVRERSGGVDLLVPDDGLGGGTGIGKSTMNNGGGITAVGPNTVLADGGGKTASTQPPFIGTGANFAASEFLFCILLFKYCL